MKTYFSSVYGSSVLSPFDRVFCDIRNGGVELGEVVEVWDDEEGRFVVAKAIRVGGQVGLEGTDG